MKTYTAFPITKNLSTECRTFNLQFAHAKNKTEARRILLKMYKDKFQNKSFKIVGLRKIKEVEVEE